VRPGRRRGRSPSGSVSRGWCAVRSRGGGGAGRSSAVGGATAVAAVRPLSSRSSARPRTAGRRRRAAGDRALALGHVPALGSGERRAAEVAGGRVAALRVLRQRAGDDAVEAGRHAVHHRGGPRRVVVQVRQHRRRHRPARVRRLAGECVVEHAAERIHVRARVDLVPRELLGRHEVRGADPLAGGREPGVGADDLGEPEVRQVGVLPGEQHVGRLDVAVHEPDRMGGVERRAELQTDRCHALRGQPPVARQQALQVGALHVAHDEVEVAALFARRVHRDHVRMVDRRGHARLALEALAEAGVARSLGRDQLDRDGAAERKLRRAVHDAHAAAAGDRLDAAAGDLGAWEQIGHGH
jgi:hypothetical protein